MDSNSNLARNNSVNDSSEYICGSKYFIALFWFIILDCGKIKEISSNTTQIVCEHCSGRIFYKKRQANRPTQYEAR